MIANQTERLNFASTKNIPDYPDFLDIQVKSFQDFFFYLIFIIILYGDPFILFKIITMIQ